MAAGTGPRMLARLFFVTMALACAAHTCPRRGAGHIRLAQRAFRCTTNRVWRQTWGAACGGFPPWLA
ncbi:exported protein of unknown function [Cupriavidus taiwanensis]|uniref:Lipoprotein n=1 Tax=Cupriavidus taiwanensis TaxID=164546 RepID=A0A7Z7NPD5_9BURK|nr:exported protein of unknown function [Cupriavidus taiwanensis]SPC23173.1 exported protein of unknown function [Cupriavidus taiwanensis]